MARIRSQHPGQWTDEDFVEMSVMARLLCLSIRNEADDYGCFEWKPKRLKMRLLPADSCDVEALLCEMEECNQITSYEVDGKKYGAIRNFCKYQRPKSPKSFCPRKPELNEYLGLEGEDVETNSEPIPNKGGNGSEITQAEGRKVGRDLKRTTNVVPKKDDNESNFTPEATDKPLKPDKTQSKRGKRLDTDWEPTMADTDFARKEGLTSADIRTEADKFRDYWIAKTGSSATKRDWTATWRNWIRNSKKSGGSFGGNTSGRRATSGQRSRSGSLSSVCADMLSGDQNTHGVSEEWGASDGNRSSDIRAEAERGRVIDG